MSNQFLGASRPIKKKTAVFKFGFFAKNAPKNAKKYFCVSGHLGNVKTYLDTKFQLIWPSNSRENQNNTLFFQKWSFFGRKVNLLDFLAYLKVKWAEIWCQNRFLKMIMIQKRRFFFCVFLSIFAKKTKFENGKIGLEASKNWLYTPVMGTHATTMASGSHGYP